MSLVLEWDDTNSTARLVTGDSGLESDSGIETAFIISIFSDARASDADLAPDPDADTSDRRGFWADTFNEDRDTPTGGLLWLAARSKSNNEATERASNFVKAATKWMVADKIFTSIDVESTIIFVNGNRVLQIRTEGFRNDDENAVFARTWRIFLNAIQ